MNITFEELWNQYQPVVDGIAATFGKSGAKWGASASDFSQEAVTWMLENERLLSRKYAEADSPDAFGKYLAQCITNEFKDYYVDIRDQAGGQPRQGAYYYTLAEVRELLPIMFDPRKWHEPPVTEGAATRGDPATGGNWIATLADVAQAYARLEHGDRVLLHRFHQEGFMNKTMAKMYGVSEATMSNRHNAAVKRLLEVLGGERPKKMRRDVKGDPWRGRHAVSNATARAMQSNYYEEG